MFDRLGIPGVLGFVVLLAGIAVIASQNLVIGGGVALVVAGLGFTVYGLVTQLAKAMGMGGMIGGGPQ